MPSISDEYLTTKQLADLLHIKERKIYDLVSQGEIPHTRALGKLLFPRADLDAWLAGHGTEGVQATQRPSVFLGSHDPFLEWSLRESGCGLATFFDGSLDGFSRFEAGEGIATGMHVFDPESEDWNLPLVKQRFANLPVVLIEWAWRERGLILAPKNPKKIKSIEELPGKTVVPRQPNAGTQVLFEHYLGKSKTSDNDITYISPARTETDAALAVQEGRADAAFGLQAAAHQYRLDFVPIVRERFDILIWRRDWFEQPMQRLMAFFASDDFRIKAKSQSGYDTTDLGRIIFNGK